MLGFREFNEFGKVKKTSPTTLRGIKVIKGSEEGIDMDLIMNYSLEALRAGAAEGRTVRLTNDEFRQLFDYLLDQENSGRTVSSLLKATFQLGGKEFSLGPCKRIVISDI